MSQPEWMPTEAEAAKNKADLSNALLMMHDQMTPVFDAADGMRTDLGRRGWSPTAAEQVALMWLMNAMQLCWAGIGSEMAKQQTEQTDAKEPGGQDD